MAMILPLLLSFLFMIYGFNYYFINTKNKIELSDLYVDSTFQLEIAKTGIVLSKESLTSDGSFNNCLGSQKNCKNIDEYGYYKLYSPLLEQTIENISLNEGLLTVNIKNKNDNEIYIISEGLTKNNKKFIATLFSLENISSNSFIPTYYSISKNNNTNINLCSIKLNDEGNIEKYINNNNTLYIDDINYNNYTYSKPFVIDNEINENISLITNKEFSSCSKFNSIYSEENINIVDFDECYKESIKKIWSNKDIFFSKNMNYFDEKNNLKDSIKYPLFKSELNNYIFGIDINNEDNSFDFSNHPYYLYGFNNSQNIQRTNSNPLGLFTILNNLTNPNSLRNNDDDYVITENTNLYLNNYRNQSVEISGIYQNTNCIYPTNPYSPSFYDKHYGWDYGFFTSVSDKGCYSLLNGAQKLACRRGYEERIAFEGCMNNNVDTSYPTEIDFYGNIEIFNGDDLIDIFGNLYGKINISGGNNTLDVDKNVFYPSSIIFSNGNDFFRVGQDLNIEIDVKNGNNIVNILGNSNGINSSIEGGEDEIFIGGNLLGHIYFNKGGTKLYVEHDYVGNLSITSGNNDINSLFFMNNVSGNINVIDNNYSNEELHINSNIAGNIFLGYGNDIVYINNSSASLYLNGNFDNRKDIFVENNILNIESLGDSSDNIFIGGNVNLLKTGNGIDDLYIDGNVNQINNSGGHSKTIINGSLNDYVDIGKLDNFGSEFLVKNSFSQFGKNSYFYNGNDKIYIGGNVLGNIDLGSDDDQIIIGGRIYSIIDGNNGKDAILLLNYSREDWDNNKDNINYNLKNFEYISFSSGTNLSNGEDVSSEVKNLICNNNETLDIEEGIYKSLSINGNCNLNFIGETFFIESIEGNKDSFFKQLNINLNNHLNLKTKNINFDNLIFQISQNNKFNFILESEEMNMINSSIKCQKPLNCLSKINRANFYGDINNQTSLFILDNLFYSGESFNNFINIGNIFTENSSLNKEITVCNLYDSNLNSINSNINWYDVSESKNSPIPIKIIEKKSFVCNTFLDCKNKIENF